MVTGGASVSAVAAAGPGAAPSAPGCVPSGADSALPPPRRSGENRRSNKPIMEKRRRARINNCLNELKSLILDAMKKDPARHSKLEKADILEMTVKHLETLQRQQTAMSAATDPAVVNKFRAGFSECASEVGRFPGLETAVRRRLLQHLANCISSTVADGQTPSPSPPNTSPTPAPLPSPQDPLPQQQGQQQPAVQVHILQSGPGAHALPTLAAAPNGIFLTTNGAGPGLQLLPTRLPNGDLALVLPSACGGFRQAPTPTVSSPSTSPVPSSSSTASSPLPMLVPVPTRTASTASASSTSSSSSAASSASPVAFDRLSMASPPNPGPALRDAATSPATAVSPPVPQPPPPAATPIMHAMYQRAPSRSPSPYEVPVRTFSPPMQRPLSLVMRKTDAVESCPCEEKPCWRPW